jgi:hypothetical protein
MNGELKKYNIHYTCNCTDDCVCGDTVEKKDGEFFKVKETQPILNRYEEQRADVASILSNLCDTWSNHTDSSRQHLIATCAQLLR